MPLYRRLPKRGFNSLIRTKCNQFKNIQEYIDNNRIKNTDTINVIT